MRKAVILKQQDIVILIKIISFQKRDLSWNSLALSRELIISQSEISESLRRSVYCGFLDANMKNVFKTGFIEYLIHGIKYSFPAKPGPMVRGIPTAHSAPPLSGIINADEKYVWSYHDGPARGLSIEPLYKTVPQAVLNDSYLYEMLALIDVIRTGKIRERNLAEDYLKNYIFNGI